MVKEEMIDLGIFGKWSVSTFKEQFNPNGNLKVSSSLRAVIDSTEPEKPENVFKKLITNGVWWSDKVVKHPNLDAYDIEEYIEDMITYREKFSEWRSAGLKLIEVREKYLEKVED